MRPSFIIQSNEKARLQKGLEFYNKTASLFPLCLAHRRMSAVRRVFLFDQISEASNAAAFLRQCKPTGLWSISASGDAPTLAGLQQIVDLANGSNGGSSADEANVIGVDKEDAHVHVPTTLAAFASRSTKPNIVLPSVIRASSSSNAETKKLGLSLIARGCFFGSESAFDLLESLVDDLAKNEKMETMIFGFAGTDFPVDSPFVQALKQATSLPHSSCVALGTVKEAEVARAMGLLPPALVGRLSRLLKELSLPGKFDRNTIDTTAVRLALSKLLYVHAVDGKVSCELPRGTFKREESCRVPVAVIERVFADALTVVPFSMNESNQKCKVRVPGSKSVSNRALLLAGLSEGSCVVRGLLHSDDTQVMMSALEQLGAKFSWMDGGDGLLVVGNGGNFASPTKPLYMGNAGTATRFVISLCALVPDPAQETRMEGSHRMEERPQVDLINALVLNGCQVRYFGKPGHLPLAILGGGFMGGEMTLSGRISSQYVSSVLFAAPYARKPLELTLAEAEPTSISYIEMTVETMKEFGVNVQRLAINKFYVPNDHGYRSPPEYSVEADASSATYALACASVYPQRSVTVHGVGSDSLQGDAQFCQFLGRMGAHVEQTKNSSTVTGSASLHPPNAPGQTEDMASLTDAFLTGVACAALCPRGSTTHISGIENQHVKECDRIAALVKELAKFSVSCDNLKDGIVVRGEGTGIVPGEEVYLDTYDDHRVAMSLAVIGTRVPKLVISDKDCTDKTYPDFWDDLSNHLKTEVKASPDLPRAWVDQSLVLIGMRGAGKSTLGRKAGSHLGWTVVDLDEYMMKAVKASSCKAIVEEQGWAAFRQLEFRCLNECLASFPTKHIIACGGGVVEYPQSRDRLQQYFPVVNIQRDFEDIELVLRPSAPASTSTPTATSTTTDGEPPSKKVKEDSQRDDDVNRPRFDEPLETVWERRRPWFVQCSNYDFVIPLSGTMEQFTKDWPAIEADFARLLDNMRKPATPETALHDDALTMIARINPDKHPDFEAVKEGLALARRHHSSKHLVVQLSPEALALDIDHQLSFLRAAARTGCEGWIMPSRTAWKHSATLRSRVLSWFGPVRLAEDPEEMDQEWFRGAALAYPGKSWFSPPAERMYYLFGHPVYASPSPTMHNTAFGILGHSQLAKRYVIFNTLDAARVNEAISGSTSFAGASVTIPHKQGISVLNRISNEAKEVGAVNTIVKSATTGELLGDNTDWIGIKRCLLGNGPLPPDGVVLVIGAGGTARAACFCVRNMGLKLVIYNRTAENAEKLAVDFNGRCVAAGEHIDRLCAIISTVPASSQWTAPEPWLALKPLVFDVAYRPRRTALLNQAAKEGCFTVEGIQMLLEQGFEQMKRFEAGAIDKASLEKVALTPQFMERVRENVHVFYDQA